jgi:hypothetical protein
MVWISNEKFPSDPQSKFAPPADLSESRQLRLLACHFCRRIWEHYPVDWADGVFASDDGYPGGYVSETVWRDPKPRDAIEAAENFCRGLASAVDLVLAHAAVAAFAQETWESWLFANRKLGDSASSAEYEVGAVTFYTAAACAAASDADLILGNCCKNAALAIGFAWDKKQERAQVEAEERIQEQTTRDWRATAAKDSRASPPNKCPVVDDLLDKIECLAAALQGATIKVDDGNVTAMEKARESLREFLSYQPQHLSNNQLRKCSLLVDVSYRVNFYQPLATSSENRNEELTFADIRQLAKQEVSNRRKNELFQ